jgi:hypothetical protein
MLRDDDLRAALVEVGNDRIAVEGLFAMKPSEMRPSMSGATDEWSDAHRIETVAGHENKVDEIAERIRQR